ncbi:MAG: DUF3536 domain-containing protein [Cyclobacteriaceae bacterium]
MNKFLCIHGHFYQPPRENAWLEEIEIQESAYPYHDWNERITAECYDTNATSRILNGQGKIVDIINNYAKISFNFGPTLLYWLEKYRPQVYHAILLADKASQKLYHGHGSAMAQVYNHVIMPLANRRDKETQVIWGLHDFKSRFGREAEGMWLAETAVDLETLEVLAERDIKFTILAPRQAKRFRKIGTDQWQEGVDSKHHYTCNLPSGKTISLFFYDGDRSQDVAFKGLLKDGKTFADTLVRSFHDQSDDPQLVHIATDGESYGHHHRHGDMALAYCLRYIEENKLARLTNYSEYMSLVQPEYEIEIHENTSWSCYHGVERWQSNCGCSSGGHPGWNQNWRSPLRTSLNWLRDQLDEIYQREIEGLVDDPWEARNKFIKVILDRDKSRVRNFLKSNARSSLDERNQTKVIRLLEMQRQSLLMFTSCGWFFDEISGLESTQILQYANRAIQIAERESDIKLESDFLKRLSKSKSNIPVHQDGAEIYRKQITPTRLTLTRVGMHYAVASLFAENPERLDILNYQCTSDHYERFTAGIQKLAIGRTQIRSNITWSKKEFSFAVIYLGQHHIVGSSADGLSLEEFQKMSIKLKNAFNQSQVYEVMDVMQRYFKSRNFSFFEMFRDEQIKVLQNILESSLAEAAAAYREIYDRNYNVLNVIRSSQMPLPDALRKTIETVINHELKQLFKAPVVNIERLEHLTRQVEKWQVPLEEELMAFLATQKLNHLISEYKESGERDDLLLNILQTLAHLKGINITPRLNDLQNEVFKLCQAQLPFWSKTLSEEDPTSDLLRKLAREIDLSLPEN